MLSRLGKLSRFGLSRLIVLALCVAVLPACATRPPANDPVALAQYKKTDDPLEPFNRGVYKFNKGLDTVLLNPISSVYTTIFPKFFRDRLKSFLDNLDSPIIWINDVLQGEGKRANDTMGRFVLNSTIGIGGLFDPAKNLGLPQHDEDFGQTLAVWGVKDGGYLMIPLYGPSSTRDGFGLVVDLIADPITWLLRDRRATFLSWPRLGARAIDKYSRNKDLLNDVQKNSVDGYAALRSYYRQNRTFEIRNGAPAPEEQQQQQNELFEQFDDEGQ